MPDGALSQEALLVPLDGGERFCVVRTPAGRPARGVVVHAPAFAEEMNKSRRMVAWCARALAQRGYAVITVDPLGCGDSPGDFGDATWARWVGDVVAAAAWMRARHPAGALWLWGLRAGALLACAALRELPRDTSLLLWQPVVAGRMHLTHFLRLSVAAGVLAADAERLGTRPLLAALEAGEPVEVAGYRLSAGLATGLGAATLDLPDGYAGRLAWLEVALDAGATPAARSRFAALESRCAGATLDAVRGPSFWQAVEIEDSPALVDATLAALASHDDARLQRAAAVL